MQQQQLTFTQEEMAIWTWLASRGIANTMAGLSLIIGEELRLHSLDLEQRPAREAVLILGGPETAAVGVHITVDGDASGSLMLVHEPKITCQLVDMQKHQLPGTTTAPDELEIPVLGEIGTVMGSSFLAALSDMTNLTLCPSPPVVMLDTVEAILDVALADIVRERGEVLAIKAAFGTGLREMIGTFLVMPSDGFLSVILEHSRVR